MTKLPVPEQWALVKMNEYEVAEEIEKFIDYVDENGRSVHLPMEFVRHFMKRDDGVLPTVVAIATMPIILADGGILALNFNEIDKDRGINPCHSLAYEGRRDLHRQHTIRVRNTHCADGI